MTMVTLLLPSYSPTQLAVRTLMGRSATGKHLAVVTGSPVDRHVLSRLARVRAGRPAVRCSCLGLRETTTCLQSANVTGYDVFMPHRSLV